MSDELHETRMMLQRLINKVNIIGAVKDEHMYLKRILKIFTNSR